MQHTHAHLLKGELNVAPVTKVVQSRGYALPPHQHSRPASAGNTGICEPLVGPLPHRNAAAEAKPTGAASGIVQQCLWLEGPPGALQRARSCGRGQRFVLQHTLPTSHQACPWSGAGAFWLAPALPALQLQVCPLISVGMQSVTPTCLAQVPAQNLPQRSAWTWRRSCALAVPWSLVDHEASWQNLCHPTVGVP